MKQILRFRCVNLQCFTDVFAMIEWHDEAKMIGPIYLCQYVVQGMRGYACTKHLLDNLLDVFVAVRQGRTQRLIQFMCKRKQRHREWWCRTWHQELSHFALSRCHFDLKTSLWVGQVDQSLITVINQRESVFPFAECILDWWNGKRASIDKERHKNSTSWLYR